MRAIIAVLYMCLSCLLSVQSVRAQRAPPRPSEVPAWQALSKLGAAVGYYNYSPGDNGFRVSEVTLPPWCGDDALALVKAFHDVKKLEFSNMFTDRVGRPDVNRPVFITDAGLANLSALGQLETLDLNQTNITGCGFAHLKGLDHLKTLEACQTNVGDEGAKQLEALKNLENLALTYTKLTDNGMESIGKLQNLRALYIRGGPLTADCLRRLLALKKLKTLWIDGIATDASLGDIEGLTELTHLSISGCNITDAGLEHLRPLKKLEYLDVSRCPKITDDAVGMLSRFPDIHWIDVQGTQFTAAGVAKLHSLPSKPSVRLAR